MSELSPGAARDQLDIGLDMLRTIESALYQQHGSSEDEQQAFASTLEQARKLFLNPVREWLDTLNAAEIRHLGRTP